jgi:hypothetical protein
MKNITVTIPDDSYRRARVWAAQHDTSISAVVRYLLETMPGIKRANSAFPANNSNPVNPVPATGSPNPEKTSVLARESVEQPLNH